MTREVDQEELREIFSHFDSDNNKVIDRDEFANLLRTLAPDISSDEIDVGLRALDANSNGTIEFDEKYDYKKQRRRK